MRRGYLLQDLSPSVVYLVTWARNHIVCIFLTSVHSRGKCLPGGKRLRSGYGYKSCNEHMFSCIKYM